jgi:acetylornithine deacetylase/succinyl-diaminopimelate desuccinylase-like protein
MACGLFWDIVPADMHTASRLLVLLLLTFGAIARDGRPVVARAGPETSVGQGSPSVTGDPLARDVFRELVEINTTDSVGSTTKAAQAMAARLKAAGFPDTDVQLLGSDPRKGNLVARLRGTGARKPILLLAHLDVVEARREDWSFDPFTFLERDGYYYGRGTTDMKDMAAAWIANLVRFRRELFRPSRDIIVALTADEETGAFNGVDYLLTNRRDLIDAEYCLNEGGGGEIHDGRYTVMTIQAAEKVYLSFALVSKNPGGHSSLPVKDNAIYHLAGALSRLARFDFPVRLNEVTRAYFERMSRLEQGQLAADLKAVTARTPSPAAVSRLSRIARYNALMRTTCVATRLEGGHAENALPQTARAVVNCRLLPDESPFKVQETLSRVVADAKVSVTPIGEPDLGPASPLNPQVMRGVESVTSSMWPGVPVVPVMATGATDGRTLRRAGIPTYGLGAFESLEDVRAHGKDERIGVRQFDEEVEFLYRVVKALASPGGQ